MSEQLTDKYWTERDRTLARRLIVAMLLALCVSVATSAFAAEPTPTVTLTLSSPSGISPAAVTLTWSSTGAISCAASGSWTGAKALSGTQTITGLTASATYTLTCKAADIPAGARVQWVIPTKNTDGSTLTDYEGVRISYGTSATTLSQVVQIASKTATAFTVSPLAAGTWYFGLRAYNTSGNESALTTPVSKVTATVPGASAAETEVFTVTTQPMPPTDITVTNPTAYEIRTDSTGKLVASRIGVVPVGTVCSRSAQRKVGTTTFSLVPREQLDLINWPQNTNIADVYARCG